MSLEHARTPDDGGDPSFLDGYISESDYAAQRGVTVRTCQRDRALGMAPPHVTVGRIVYYRLQAIRDDLLAREKQNRRRRAS